MKIYLNYLTKNLAYVIFLFAAGSHLIFATIGWNNSIADYHPVRQTHTAITAYYFIKEGFKINYITPVLGAPWSIPIEFPLYQYLASLIAQTKLIPLDQTGRLISLLFFYLSLLMVYKILKLVNIKRNYCFLILSLILVNPIYIFWSRTFMIESTALFFSLAYILSCFKSVTGNSKKITLFAVLIGILAALIKITTFVVILPLIFLGCYYLNRDKSTKLPTAKLFILMSIPLIFGCAWTLYANYISTLNPIIAKHLALESAAKWYLGDLGQRTSTFYWAQIFKTIQRVVINHIILFFIPLLVIFIRKNRSFIIVLILTFLAGPLFFTNMYFVHDYYFYANSVYLIVALGLILISLLESYSSKIILLAYPIVLILSLWSYKETYLPIQKNNNKAVTEIGNFINSNTREEDIILFEDHDYNPEIPYYSKRKAIMLAWGYKIDDQVIQQSLNMTGRERVKALVTTNNKDQVYTDYELALLGFSRIPVFQNSYGIVYFKI